MPNIEKMKKKKNIKGLAKVLRDKEEYYRKEAAEALGELGDPKAVKPLVQAMNDEKRDVRDKAAAALVKIGEPAVNPLIQVLKDKDPKVRFNTATALGMLKDSRAVDPLIQALMDKDPKVRFNAAAVLGMLGDPRAVDPLIQALEFRDPDIYLKAALILGKLGDSRAVNPLIRKMGDRYGFGLKERARDALVRIGKPAVSSLIQALSDGDPEVRKGAVEALDTLGDLRAVDPLIQVLKDKNEWVRIKAVDTLGKLGDLRAVDPLIQALTDENQYVRKQAAVSLGKLKDTRVVDPLLQVLADRHPGVRIGAIEALGMLKDPKVMDPLIQALTDENKDVRKQAAISLGEIGDPRAWVPLTKMYQHGFQEYDALNALQKIGEPTVDVLIQALTDEDTRVRGRAIEILEKLEDPRAVDLLIQVYTDEAVKPLILSDSYVVNRARDALVKIGKPAVDPLIQALQDIRLDRHIIIRVLVKIGKPAVDSLIQALTDGNIRVRKGAIETLGILRDPRAVDTLIQALTDENKGVRFMAATALGNLGDTRAVDTLIQMLTDKAPDVRVGAVETLSMIGDPKTVEPLIQMLTDEAPDVRRRAVKTLGKLGDPKTMAPLTQAALTDEDSMVRFMAARTLGKLGRIISVSKSEDPYLKSCYTFDFSDFAESRNLDDFPDLKEINKLSWSSNSKEILSKTLPKLESIWSNFSDFHLAYIAKSNLFKSMGKHAEAKAILQEGLEKSRSKYALLNSMGDHEFQYGSLSEAVRFWICSVVTQKLSGRCTSWSPFLYLAYIAEEFGLTTISNALTKESDKINVGKPRFNPSLVTKVGEKVRTEGTASMRAAITLTEEYL